MSYRGDYRLGDSVYFKFTTATTTGAPTQLAGTPVVSAYPNNSTTQITAGITLTVDFDSVTGLNHVTVAATGGNGYATATDYDLVITTGTVGGTSAVGYVVGAFSIENRSALRPTTAARTLDVSSTGEAGIDWANIGSPTTSQTLSGTSTKALEPTTAGRTLDVTATGEAGIDWANIGGTTTTQALSNTTIASVTSAGLSAAAVDAVWDEVLSGATHNVASSAGRRLRTLQDNGVYALASVWVDEVAGTSTGTVSYEDGTVTNRSDDFDNAQTIANAIDINTIHVQNGNAITLTAGLEGYNVFGNGATIALGSQNIGATFFREFTGVTGVGTTTGGIPVFRDCAVGSVTLPPSIFDNSVFYGTVTVGSAGDFLFNNCASYVAGTGAPVLDMGAAVGATTVSLRKWSGGLTINNIAAGDVISVDAVSGGIITLNGADGNVQVRGMVNIVDNRTGSPTLGTTNNMDARFDTVDAAIAALNDPTVAEIADAVWDEAIAGHLGAGSTGEALNAAGAAGDPWVTALPGAYGAGSAGYIVGNNLDAPVGTVDTVVDAIKAKTDSLTFSKAGEVDANIQSINDTTIVGDGSGTPFNV